jgi:hypothetical protein
VKFDCYSGEQVTKEQVEALENFENHPEWISNAKPVVETFCSKKVAEDLENQKKDNIFSYLKPDYLFIKRDSRSPRVAIMCKYRYDMENGLAVVFSNSGSASVGLQDSIL